MNDTGQDMRATLLAGSDDMPPGIDLLRVVREQAAARHRHRRRKARDQILGNIDGVGDRCPVRRRGHIGRQKQTSVLASVAGLPAKAA